MAGLKSMVIVLAVMMVASFHPQFAVAQTRHVVGDTLGWTIPSDTSAYTTWASTQTFRVGDSLFFNFTTGAHDVAEVSEAAYGPCTTTNTMSTTLTGPATIRLTTAGDKYYICTFGTHCNIGQKVSINVVAASTSTTPPSATSPAPSATSPAPSATSPAPSATSPAPSATSPAPSGTTMPDGMPSMPPPPPSPSSASAFTAIVPVTFLAAVIALFY